LTPFLYYNGIRSRLRVRVRVRVTVRVSGIRSRLRVRVRVSVRVSGIRSRDNTTPSDTFIYKMASLTPNTS
jgi:hypothetical protein